MPEIGQAPEKKIEKGVADVMAHTADAVLALQKLAPETGGFMSVVESCSSCGAGSCF
jgi:hypothetical protein